jgi:hypothetical protein
VFLVGDAAAFVGENQIAEIFVFEFFGSVHGWDPSMVMNIKIRIRFRCFPV